MNMINLYCDDCLKILPTIETNSIDLIYADFIYDDLNFTWVDLCIDILKDGGSFYAQTDYRSVAQLKLYLDNKLDFCNWIVWCYKAHPQRRRFYQRKHDDILFYTKGGDYTWNNPTQPPSKMMFEKFRTDENGKIINPSPAMAEKGTHYIRDVVARDWWDDIPVPSGFSPWDTGKKLHKWQKPIGLLKRIIGASSNPGDIVLDPFMGSGTTGAACIQLGRNFIGIEIDKKTFSIAKKRIKEAERQLVIPIFGGGDVR